MRKYDNKILNDLFKISSRINQIYNSLWQMEINHKKESNGFKEKIKLLKELIIEENNLYEKIDSKYAYDFIKSISDGIIPSFNDLISSIYDSDECVTEARVFNRLKKIVNLNPVIINDRDSIKELDVDIDLDLDLDDDEQEYESNNYYEGDNYIGFDLDYQTHNMLVNVIESDILNTIITILNNYINNRKYKKIKVVLTRYKYMFSCIFSSVEKSFIENDFNVYPNLYWESKLIIDCQNISVSILERLKDYSVENILYNHIDNLMGLLEENIHKGKNYVHAISSQILIRACLLFANEDTIDSFIYSTVEDLINFEAHNDEILNIIFNSLNNINKDREIPKILSLKID